MMIYYSLSFLIGEISLMSCNIADYLTFLTDNI